MSGDPLIGTKLGDYVVERMFASGGMGIVYRAVHPILGRAVAIKVLRQQYARDDDQVERFLREAKAISAIRHRGIVAVENFGNLADGRQYMIMPFLEGETLETLFWREKKLSVERALPIIDEVLDALSAAHKVGVIHRDLKPTNVFLEMQSNGTRCCKLVDFGLARKEVLNVDEVRKIAKASMVAGTPEYIAPEQANGSVAGARTDLYSVGVMLFELLTGQLPFHGDVRQLVEQHSYTTAPRVKAFVPVPESVDALVASLLEKNPDKRPSTADAVRLTVARILRDLKESKTIAMPKIEMGDVPTDAVKFGPGNLPGGSPQTREALGDEAMPTDNSPAVRETREAPPSVPPAGARASMHWSGPALLSALGVVAIVAVVALLDEGPEAPAPMARPAMPSAPVPRPPVEEEPAAPAVVARVPEQVPARAVDAGKLVGGDFYAKAFREGLPTAMQQELGEQKLREKRRTESGLKNDEGGHFHNPTHCQGDWKTRAKKKLNAVTEEKNKGASKDDQNANRMAHSSFLQGINDARTVEKCLFALDAIETYRRSK